MEDASGGQSEAIGNEMKMNLRNVIRQAKKGSRQHIIELAEEIASIPEALRSDAFEAFATHIGGPASGGDDDVLVMSGIGYLGHNGFFEGNNACVSTVSKIWKSLFANMRAHCDKLRKDPAAARRGQDAVAAMASVLCAFATNERLHQQIFSGSSAVFKLVSQLWYLEDLETSASWTLPYTSASIGMIFRGNDVRKGVDILAQQAGGNIDRVVEGFLVRLRKAIRD
ncbi:hypothetical protein DFH11DRAFT_923356 [Phellopilus nigrolimitatus]|nr:hypothetical protein DFH11DRAFT_923356 [Phellopilus nigrolimitatus]